MFLDRDGVPFENNLAECSIRPAVILGKSSDGNRSEQRADFQTVLMGIFRTLKLRRHAPISTIFTATQHYIRAVKRPHLASADLYQFTCRQSALLLSVSLMPLPYVSL